MEGSPVPPSADPGGHYHSFHNILWLTFFFPPPLVGEDYSVHLLHVFVGSLCLNFQSTLFLVSDSVCSPSFLPFSINANDPYVSSWPFCQSKMSSVQDCFRPGASIPCSISDLGDTLLSYWLQVRRHWFPSFDWKYFFCCNIGGGCLFYDCVILVCLSVMWWAYILRFSALSSGENTPIYQRGYWFQTDRPCDLYFVIQFLCHRVLIKSHPNSPLNWRDSLLSSEKFIKMLLLFLTALMYWDAVRQCVISIIIIF